MTRQKKLPIPESLREDIFKRDKYRCRYCGSKDGPFHADHVFPESRGGPTCFDNLATACYRCNSQKSARLGIWPKPIEYWDEKDTLETEHKSNLASLENKYHEIFEEIKKDQRHNEINASNKAIESFREDGVKRTDFYAFVLSISSIFWLIGTLYMFGGILDIAYFQPTIDISKGFFYLASIIEMFSIGIWSGRALALRRNNEIQRS